MKKEVLWVMFALIIGMVFMGCNEGSKAAAPAANDSEPSGTVNFINIYDSGKVRLYEMFDKFREDNPNINLEITVIPSSNDINKQLMILAAAETPPDVVTIDSLYVQPFAAMGVLEDITDRVNNDMGFDKNLFYPASLAINEFNGKLYGIPFTTNCLAVYYNKTILAEYGIPEPKPDWTWDDYYAIAEKTSRPREGVFGAVMSGRNDAGSSFHFFPWFWSAGGDVFHPDSEAGRDAFTFLRRLLDNELMSKDIMTFGQTDASAQFSGGRAVLFPGGCWHLADYERNIKDFEFGIVNYPLNPKTGKYNTALGGYEYNLIKGGNVDAAWEFVKYMSSAEVTAYFNPPENYIPARRDVAESIPYYTDQDSPMRVYREGMNNAVMRGPHYFWLDIDTAWQGAMQSIYSGMDIEPVLQDAQVKIDNIMAN